LSLFFLISLKAFLFELAIADFLALSPLSIKQSPKRIFNDINLIVTNFYKISTILLNI